MAEIMTSRAKTIRVNREDRDTEEVRSRIRNLNMFHIKFVLDRMKNSKTSARNIRAFIITVLYNADMQMESYYADIYAKNDA